MNTQPEPIPARMVNEFVYCPRLFHLEYVGAEWRKSADTIDGARIHKRVDQPRGNLADEDANGEGGQLDELTGLHLSCPKLGVTAVLDRAIRDGEAWVPVDTKRGKVPPSGVLWPADRIQVGIQALLLRAEGYRCDKAAVYYAASKRRIEILVDAGLEADVRQAIQGALECSESEIPPPPLEDSPKCQRCSLQPICLPDETRMVASGGGAGVAIPRIVPMTDDAVPLYIQTQGARVGVSGERLVVATQESNPVEIRILDVSQLCVFGGVSVSTSAIKELTEREIPICWFSTGGWFYSMAHGVGSKNGLVRLAQARVCLDEERSLQFARAMVARKIANQRTLLMRNGKEVQAQTLDAMKTLSASAETAESAESLLGVEGMGAKHYFQSFGAMIRKSDAMGTFDFESRNRRPPRDPVNALLSMAYATLTKDFTVTLAAVGLDPYFGVFHKPGRGKPALALDLMEEFRPLIADSVVLQLINNGEVDREHFVMAGEKCALSPSGRKKFYSAYDRRMSHEITHPMFGYKVSYRQVLEIQARLFQRALTGELPEYLGLTTR